MSDLILHQYALSPFSEKIRAMLGYAELPWQAVDVQEMPPRPELAPLASGYRKIPVAQLGADVFCDTRTIAREIAHLSGRSELDPDRQPQPVQDFVQTLDLEVFLACVLSASGGSLLFKLVRCTSILHTYRFLKDRIQMGRQARVPAMGPKQARRRVAAHVEDLEKRLEADFLFGDRPCVADFSAYHGLWFVADLAGKPVLREAPRVRAWMARMRAFGHGEVRPITAGQALQAARDSEPRPLPDGRDHPQLGSPVSITPNDYGRIPVTGQLLADDGQRWVVAHDHDRVGRVHIHVPHAGFVLTPA
ncbi:glutathione S-transferase family protein [Marinobacter sp. JSM 1782161]|uniref:glutathione S-transferase family protein n=1 Tax=Marinobacter sp. JSM 1782161 TaxID=2685906 RepID=UPI0014021879|nr:glutathione S-transferase family protein [Marinobacter sp. JSM 1782161]